MSNGTSTDFSGTISNLAESIGQLAQVQFELLRAGINTTASVFSTIGRTSVAVTTGVLNAVSRILQGTLSVFAQKK